MSAMRTTSCEQKMALWAAEPDAGLNVTAKRGLFLELLLYYWKELAYICVGGTAGG